MTTLSDASQLPLGNNPAVRREEPINEMATAPSLSGVVVTAADSRWDVSTKRTVVFLLLFLSLVALWVARPVIPMMILSGIVAYLLSPIVDLCERIRIPRAISTMVLFVLVLVGVVLLPVLLIPVLVEQLAVLSNFNVSGTAAAFINWISERLNSLPETLQFMGYVFTIRQAVNEFQTNFQQLIVVPTLAEILTYLQQIIGTATNLVNTTATIGINIASGIVQLFASLLITFFLSLYLTKDAPQIRSYVQGLFPPSYQSELMNLIRQVGHIWQNFFRGQLILCFTMGVTVWLALTAAGMPGALILGIAAGLLEIVPSLGPTLAAIPAVIVALIQGSQTLNAYGIDNVSFALITVAIYFIIQQLENNILVPRIIGDSVNLHPVVIICGVVIGYNLFGLFGTFLAAPVIATLRTIGSYVHAKLLDYPPFSGRAFPPPKPRRTLIYRRTVKGDDARTTPSASTTRGQQAKNN
jgi:predicted PurR-regulated permease PerM